jgi:hypothetical protein
LSIPTLSLLLPALAVSVASAGGSGEITKTAADVSRFLLYYSGVFALVALTAAVAAGLLATDRTVMSPDRRILAQAAHRTTSLIGISALANHIMLEVLANRARLIDGFVPFLAARSTFYMGLGTVASDLFVVIIITGALRKRFTKGRRPWVWRALHVAAYLAWPMAVLHGLLAGRPAKPYVDWSYGGCLAAVLLALTFRYVVLSRGRDAAGPAPRPQPRPPLSPPAAQPAGAGYPGQPAQLGPAGYPGRPAYPARPPAPAGREPVGLAPPPGSGPWRSPDYASPATEFASPATGLVTPAAEFTPSAAHFRPTGAQFAAGYRGYRRTPPRRALPPRPGPAAYPPETDAADLDDGYGFGYGYDEGWTPGTADGGDW